MPVAAPHQLSTPRLQEPDLAELDELRAFGVRVVVLVSSEDLASCAPCRAIVGRVLQLDDAPIPPIAACAVVCRCQLAPLVLE